MSFPSHICPNCGQKLPAALSQKDIWSDKLGQARLLRKRGASYYAVAKEIGVASVTVYKWRDKGMLD